MKETKELISLRLDNRDRTAVQSVATRLNIRESDIYRFAITFLLNRCSCLLDETCNGSDLLLAMVDMLGEINSTVGFKKNQLDKIINGNNLHPDKYVAMVDIELLLMPQHLLKQQLMKYSEMPKNKLDTEEWLKAYLIQKYKLLDV